MIVPMAENLLGWTDRDSSIFYSVAGVEVSQSAYDEAYYAPCS